MGSGSNSDDFTTSDDSSSVETRSDCLLPDNFELECLLGVST